MDYLKLKKEIKEISEIACGVPEQFRDKCFEILLSNLLSTGDSSPIHPPKAKQESKDKELKTPKTLGAGISTPAQIRVLMSKTGVTTDDIAKVLFVEDGEVHFFREPSHTTVAKGQIEWALLLALKNGLLNNTLAADPEEVRSICQDKGFYDRANFAKNFKNENAKKLFKDTMKAQGEAQALSTEGQEALGTLIKDLAGSSN